MSMRPHLCGLALASALVPAAAMAQPERSGAFIGGGLGLGTMRFSSDDGSEARFGSAAWRVAFGGFLAPELALALEVWGTSSPQDDEETLNDYTVHQGNAGLSLRLWPRPRLWLQGGIGGAKSWTSWEGGRESPPYEGVSLLAGAGFEVAHGERWVLELTGRWTLARYADESRLGGQLTSSSLAIDVGVFWY